MFTQSELLIEFHRMLKFGFLEGITLFSTAYDTQLRKKKAEEQNHEVNNPQDSTWSGSAKVSGPRLVLSFVYFDVRFQMHSTPGHPRQIDTFDLVL